MVKTSSSVPTANQEARRTGKAQCWALQQRTRVQEVRHELRTSVVHDLQSESALTTTTTATADAGAGAAAADATAAAAVTPFCRPRPVGAWWSRPGVGHRLAAPPLDATGAHVEKVGVPPWGWRREHTAVGTPPTEAAVAAGLHRRGRHRPRRRDRGAAGSRRRRRRGRRHVTRPDRGGPARSAALAPPGAGGARRTGQRPSGGAAVRCGAASPPAAPGGGRRNAGRPCQ